MSDTMREKEIEELITSGIDLSRTPRFAEDAFWTGLRRTGTELWLDTGDLDAAGEIWTGDFSGLTTNNTLLNAEVQKGIYDETIREAGKRLGDLPLERRVVEIAFILNARHGLRLVERFGVRVSVEIHTDLAHDVEGSLAFARRFHAISPERFTIKVPMTPEGLIVVRTLRAEGIPVNFTLGFSARQNYLAAVFSRPDFVNVFLGRLNSFVAENGLGDGAFVGERATVASQRAVRSVGTRGAAPTRQIAASLREASQLESLAGVDVHTIPVKVARSGRGKLEGKWEDRTAADYAVEIDPSRAADLGAGCLWEISPGMERLAADLDARPPRSAEELVRRAQGAALGELFPMLGERDLGRIAEEGKIPRFPTWEARLRKREVALDSLLNLAALASFRKDQAELDGRIRELLG